MQRIVALNQRFEDEEPVEEMAVTKEAEETIVESEYTRAIRLISQGKSELALQLLTELLETKVLSEISIDPANEKLRIIRYNCHKNIAFICEKNNQVERALQNYVQAMDIDESDVYAMHRCGQLALKMNALELAQLAFEICLKRNPSHWGAADGMLQTLLRNHNVLGAFGWASKLILKDPGYVRALVTLRDIFSRFKGSIPLFEKFFGPFPISEESAEQLTIDQDQSEWWSHVNPKTEISDGINRVDLNAFRVQRLGWDTIGHYIIFVYNHLQETEQSMLFAFNLDDIWAGSVLDDTKETSKSASLHARDGNSSSSGMDTSEDAVGERSQEPPPFKLDTDNNHRSESAAFVSPTFDHGTINIVNPSTKTSAAQAEVNEDSDSNTKSDGGDGHKPTKQRRRCSDLLFLEQWGWHKNRRYNTRKKAQLNRPEADTSFNGFLRKVFAKYMNTSFEDAWPFSDGMEMEFESSLGRPDETNCSDCESSCGSLESFQAKTALAFDCFVQKLMAKPFDLTLLAYKWLKYISSCWNKRFPPLLSSLYLEIFQLYLTHFDLANWNQLSEQNFQGSYRMCLLALELDNCRQRSENSEASDMWKRVFDHLCLQTCLGRDTFGNQNSINGHFRMRLVQLEYLAFADSGQLEQSVVCLEILTAIIAKEPDSFKLHLPNLKGNCITKNRVRYQLIDLQRQIARNKIPKLFEAGKWSDLLIIISENIAHSRDNFECVDSIRDFKVQLEVLLDAMQKLDANEQCLRWSERFLHYASYRFIGEPKYSQQQRLWEEVINFVLSHIGPIIRNEGFDIVTLLDDKLARMIQNLVRVLTYHLESAPDKLSDKQNGGVHELDMRRFLVVLHQLAMREELGTTGVVAAGSCESEEDEDSIPNSYMLLFTGHEHLGKRQLCTKDNGEFLLYTLDTVASNLRAPLYDGCREQISKYVEQVTYCLYGYPQKKARSRHLEDHEAITIDLTWPRAVQLFDMYRPESLPEFNSYKLESISTNMEQMLLKILALMPKELDPTPSSARITKFISGDCDLGLQEEEEVRQAKDLESSLSTICKLPYKIQSIFYLLADYYFKNRDFSKAIKYYTLDLASNLGRFDSWAGMALSKASKIETKLNMLAPICPREILGECEETIRCFERCINLDQSQTLLWIEYGSFTYTIHSFCSRLLKSNSDKLDAKMCDLVTERKQKMLGIAYNCFSLAAVQQSSIVEPVDDESGDSHEEKWLPQYMLGKIAEKRMEHPNVYLKYYLNASNYLYESSAAYPIKINHSHPAPLCVEALEVFYRTNAAIIKHLERAQVVSRDVGDLFNKVLAKLANSPFAYNKAKIDGNALKRKIVDKEVTSSQQPSSKGAKRSKEQPIALSDTLLGPACSPSNPAAGTTSPQVPVNKPSNNEDKVSLYRTKSDTKSATCTEAYHKNQKMSQSKIPSRRESQESGATATTTTVTSTATSSSSCASSSSDSNSESDVSSIDKSKNRGFNAHYSAKELEDIFKTVVQNLEECVIRFSEHYKSIYRLVCHYVNAPLNLRDLARGEQLLLGQYTTTVGNRINGLFYDRKNNKNFFNGIWRNPSSEIDRPGSFSAHLVKCVALLIELLTKAKKYTKLVEIGLQLYKTPDGDKRYISDIDRIKLYQQAITNCAKTMRVILESNIMKRNDTEVLNLMVDVYKIHKQCVKYITQKEPLFTQLLVDVYRFYIVDKVEFLPMRVNFLDLAIKLCLQEIEERKNLDRPSTSQTVPTMGSMKNIPGLNLRRSYVQKTSSSLINQPRSFDSCLHDASIMGAPLASDFSPNSLMSMMTREGAMHFQKMLEEHYKQMLGSKLSSYGVRAVSQDDVTTASSASVLETIITPSPKPLSAINQSAATSTNTQLFDEQENDTVQKSFNYKPVTEPRPSQMTVAFPRAVAHLAESDTVARDGPKCTTDNKSQQNASTKQANPKQEIIKQFGRSFFRSRLFSSSDSSEDEVIVTHFDDSPPRKQIDVIILD